MRAPTDKEIRQKALDIECSFAVSAPAGSGKTELLIRRYMSLLTVAERPEEILAITFTRKAAAEMQERVLRALADSANGVQANSEHHAETLELARKVLLRNETQKWNLRECPFRLQIRTIDSLCHSLASSMPFESGFVNSPALVEDANPWYLLATQNLLDASQGDHPCNQALSTLLDYYDNNLDQLAQSLSELLSIRTSWLPVVVRGEFSRDQLESLFAQLIDRKLEQCEELLYLWPSFQEMASYAAENLDTELADSFSALSELSKPPKATNDDLEMWQVICKLVLTDSGTLRKQLTKTQGFPTEDRNGDKPRAKKAKADAIAVIEEIAQNPQLVESLAAVQKLPKPEFQADQWPVIDALMLLLPHLAAQLNVEFQTANISDYSGVSLAAEQALRELGEPTRLALKLDYKINHILVDEFQDTSTSQVRLLQMLTEGWQPGDGRSLFIVGDGMQSIYGFRKANVGLFINAREHGIGSVELQPLDLESNFRSQAGLIDWFNGKFENLFPAEDDIAHGQVRYRPSSAIHDEYENPISVTAHSTVDEEAQAIATAIAARRIAEPDQQIAILVRARSHLTAILPALRNQGLSWQGTDIEPLSQRLCVSDIHSITRVLHSPADRLGWLTLLRAPFVGLDMHDLYHFCRHRYDEKSGFRPISENLLELDRITTISVEAKSTLQRLKLALDWAIQNLGECDLYSLIDCTWRCCGGPETLRGEAERNDVAAYLDLLDRHNNSGLIDDWEEFLRELDKLFALPDPAADENIQIMTIHKAKGLEFDSVYLPRLDATTGGGDTPLLLWWEREFEDGQTHFLFSSKGSKTSDNGLYDYLKREESARQTEENVRLLYVACTRAKQHLSLSATLSPDKRGAIKPAKNSLLASLWSELEDDFLASAERLSFSDDEQAAQLQPLTKIRRLPTNWSSSSDLPSFTPQSNPESLIDSSPDNWDLNNLARTVGTLLHQSLESFAQEHAENQSEWLEAQKRIWASELQKSGVSERLIKDALVNLDDSFTTILADKTGRWLLGTEHQESACELSIDYLDSKGNLRNAIIDRTFIDMQDTRWIVDYKSSKPNSGQSIDEFLQQQSEHYRPQLERYRNLFTQENRRVRLLLYFPSIANSCELMDDSVVINPDLSSL